MTIRHALIAALATTALVSPAAQAQTPDMHASTAEAAAKARALTPATEGGGAPWSKQDQRSPDAPAAQAPQRSGSTPGANRGDGGGENAELFLESRPSPAGQPTRQTNPTTPGATDDGSPVPVLPIVAGVLGVLIAALTAHYGVRRSSRRSRIAA
jgi:hypothetical protein